MIISPIIVQMIPASKTEAFYFKEENKQTLNSKKGRDGSIKDTEKRFIWDALRDSVIFVQFKKLKNTHEGVLLLKPAN